MIPGGDAVSSESILPAKIADAEDIARLETHVWRVAYQGLLPQPLLDGLSETEKTEFWRGYLTAEITTFVLREGERIVGYAGCGPEREFEGGILAGEIYAIYLHPDRWRRGYGRALFERCRDVLREHGYEHLMLWVLRDNKRARSFYESLGMRHDGASKVEHLQKHPLHQIRYRSAPMLLQ